MGDRGLGLLEQRHQLADAHLAGVRAQHVDELQADGVGQRLGDGGHALGLHALEIGVDNRLTAGFAGGPLLLGRQLDIDRHLSISID